MILIIYSQNKLEDILEVICRHFPDAILQHHFKSRESMWFENMPQVVSLRDLQDLQKDFEKADILAYSIQLVE